MAKRREKPRKQPMVWDFTLLAHRNGCLSIQSSQSPACNLAAKIVELTLLDDQQAVMEIIRLELSGPMTASPIR